MADWIILLLLVALGLGGYWLMGRVGGYLANNLARHAVPTGPVEGWTAQTLLSILGRKECKKEGRAHGRDANAPRTAGTTHGCAG